MVGNCISWFSVGGLDESAVYTGRQDSTMETLAGRKLSINTVHVSVKALPPCAPSLHDFFVPAFVTNFHWSIDLHGQ